MHVIFFFLDGIRMNRDAGQIAICVLVHGGTAGV